MARGRSGWRRRPGNRIGADKMPVPITPAIAALGEPIVLCVAVRRGAFDRVPGHPASSDEDLDAII